MEEEFKTKVADIMTRTQKFGFFAVVFTLFIDTMLYSLLIPMIPHYQSEYLLSPSIMSLLFSSYAISLLIATPFFGSFSDRVGRKGPLLIGLFLIFMATIIFAFAKNVYFLFAARMIQGIGAASTWTVALALLADLFEKEKRGKVMGSALTGMSAGTLLGAPIGGVLYEWFGTTVTFLIVSGLAMAIYFFVFMTVQEPPHASEDKHSYFELLKSRRLLRISIIILVAEGLLTMIEPLLPIYIEETFHKSAVHIGLLFGFSTIGYAIGAPISGTLSDKFSSWRMILVGMVCASLLLPVLFMDTPFLAKYGIMFLLGFSFGFTLSPTLPELSVIVDEIAPGAYAMVYAWFNLLFGISMIIGPLTGGLLMEQIGLINTIQWMTAGALVMTIFISFSLKLRRRAR